jgi:branched-chain amino acid transport system substrate-binding protein
MMALALFMPILAACGGSTSSTATSAPAAAATTAATKAATSAAAASSPAAGASASASPAASEPSGDTSKGTINIYSSWPLTGSSQKLGSDMVKSVQLAIADHKGAAGGFKINFTALDDATAAQGTWDAGKESENANKVISDPDAMVYIGTYNSGAAKISIPILNNAGMGMISPANTYPGLTKNIQGVVEANEPNVYFPNGSRNYCRVVPSDELQGAVGAQWAQELGAKKVYVLDDTQLYGHGIAIVFAQTAKKLGMEVVGQEGIDYKAPDYRALMTKIKGTNPDLVYFGGLTDTNAGKLVQDMRAVGMAKTTFMGPDGLFNDDFIKAAGAAAENTYATFGGVPPSQLTGKGADWYKNFKAKYNAEPDAYAIYAYEATNVALAAIDKVGKKDRAAILDAMIHTKDFNGLLGNWSFTDTGDTTLTTMSGNVVKNGKWEFVKTLQVKP